MRSFSITVTPDRARPGFFIATLDGVELCRTREPLLAAARELFQRGAPADARISMRHAGADVHALHSTIRAAAKVTIEERRDGGLRLAPWKAPPRDRQTLPMRFPDQAALSYRVGPRQRISGGAQ